MFIGLTFLFIFLVIIIMIIIASRRYPDPYIDDSMDEEEFHTTTTTTTTTHVHEDPPYVAAAPQYVEPSTAGTITRGWEDNKPYVLDPVDGVKFFLNEADDQYEDAAGKMWKLI